MLRIIKILNQTIFYRSRKKKKKRRGGRPPNSNPVVTHQVPLKSPLRSPVKLPTLHKCQSCPKRFNTLEHLQRHILTHSKTKPFKCPHCVLGELTISISKIRYNLRMKLWIKILVLYKQVLILFVNKYKNVTSYLCCSGVCSIRKFRSLKCSITWKGPCLRIETCNEIKILN